MNDALGIGRTAAMALLVAAAAAAGMLAAAVAHEPRSGAPVPARLEAAQPRSGQVTPEDAPATAAPPRPRGADIVAGKGAWVDVFDGDTWNEPQAVVDRLAREQVQTLYLQVGRTRSPYAVYRPEAARRFIDHAHRRGINVVAWYLPTFDRLDLDQRRIKRALELRTAGGAGFDALALDIESAVVADIDARVARTLELSAWLRRTAGPGYTLAAIIPPPTRSTNQPGGAWPRFPYAELARTYDAWMPMSFFVQARPDGTHSRAAVRRLFAADIATIRRATRGAPQLPIHVIAETAAEADAADLAGFLDAVAAGRAQGVTGASLYDVRESSAADWRALRRLDRLFARDAA